MALFGPIEHALAMLSKNDGQPNSQPFSSNSVFRFLTPNEVEKGLKSGRFYRVPRHWLVLGSAPPKYRKPCAQLFGTFPKWKFLVPTWHKKSMTRKCQTHTGPPVQSLAPSSDALLQSRRYHLQT